MEKLHELKAKACNSLDDIAGSRSLNLMNPEDRKITHELVEIIKGLDKIFALEGEDYYHHSNRDGGEWEADMRGSYGDSSYVGRKRDSKGRYSRKSGIGGYRGGGSSYGGGKEALMEHVNAMEQIAGNEHEHEMILRFKEQLEQL